MGQEYAYGPRHDSSRRVRAIEVKQVEVGTRIYPKKERRLIIEFLDEPARSNGTYGRYYSGSNRYVEPPQGTKHAVKARDLSGTWQQALDYQQHQELVGLAWHQAENDAQTNARRINSVFESHGLPPLFDTVSEPNGRVDVPYCFAPQYSEEISPPLVSKLELLADLVEGKTPGQVAHSVERWLQDQAGGGSWR